MLQRGIRWCKDLGGMEKSKEAAMAFEVEGLRANSNRIMWDLTEFNAQEDGQWNGSWVYVVCYWDSNVGAYISVGILCCAYTRNARG